MSTVDAHPANNPIAAPPDAALPGAVLLDQPRRLVEVLAPLLAGWLDPDARLVDSRVTIHRYVPGKRCLAELALVIAPGGAESVEVRTVLGKFYAGEEGAQVHDTLRRLWASGFSDGPLTVPRPIAYDPDWRLLLTSQAGGVVLRDLLPTASTLVPDGRRTAEPILRLPPSADLSAARVRLYEAITYLKLVHIIACIARPRGWRQSVATLLQEAQKTV